MVQGSGKEAVGDTSCSEQLGGGVSPAWGNRRAVHPGRKEMHPRRLHGERWPQGCSVDATASGTHCAEYYKD